MIDTKTASAKVGEIPLSLVVLRIKEEPKFYVKESTGGKSLIFKFEVASPATVKGVQGEDISVAGREMTQYIPVEGKGQFRFVDMHKALRDNGNPIPDSIGLHPDTGIPEGIVYTGMQLYGNIRSEVQDVVTGTGEAAETVVNPFTGKAQSTSRLNLTRFVHNES